VSALWGSLAWIGGAFVGALLAALALRRIVPIPAPVPVLAS